MSQNQQPNKIRATMESTTKQMVSRYGICYQFVKKANVKPLALQNSKASQSTQQYPPITRIISDVQIQSPKFQTIQPTAVLGQKRSASQLVNLPHTIAVQQTITPPTTRSPSLKGSPSHTTTPEKTKCLPPTKSPPPSRTPTIQEPTERLSEAIQKESPMKLQAWTQTNPHDFEADQNDLASIMDNIRSLKAQLQAKLDLFSKLREQEDKQLLANESQSIRDRILADSNETKESEVILHFCDVVEAQSQIIPSELQSDEDQIQLNVQAEAEANAIIEQAQSETADHSHVHPEEKAVLDAHIKAEVDHAIMEITKEIEDSGDGGINTITDDPNEPLIEIGPNGTKIKVKDFEKLNWNSASAATRKLLTILFKRETLATHSMTGKASPAFKNQDRPVKRQLNQKIIDDIISVVSFRANVPEKDIRTIITTKCADENKMLKLKQSRTLMQAFRSIESTMR